MEPSLLISGDSFLSCFIPLFFLYVSVCLSVPSTLSALPLVYSQNPPALTFSTIYCTVTSSNNGVIQTYMIDADIDSQEEEEELLVQVSTPRSADRIRIRTRFSDFQ